MTVQEFKETYGVERWLSIEAVSVISGEKKEDVAVKDMPERVIVCDVVAYLKRVAEECEKVIENCDRMIDGVYSTAMKRGQK